MSPASAQLLELLGQLRGASRLGRARLLALAAKQLRQLTADERRVLATEAARRAAPHLLPRVDALVDEKLSGPEAKQFVDLLNQMDGDAIADLATGVAAALDAPGSSEPPASEGGRQTASSHDEDHLAGPDQEQAMDIVADLSLDATQPEPMVLVQDLHDQPPSLDEPWNVSADGEVAAVPIIVEPTEAPLPGGPEQGSGGGGGGEGDDQPGPDVPASGVVQPGLAVLPGRIRVVDPEDGPADPLDLLRAVPDGWRRRRLALDLLEQARLRPAHARGIVGLFGRDSDRAWVAGAMLDAGLAALDQLADLLPHHALPRLARRQSALLQPRS